MTFDLGILVFRLVGMNAFYRKERNKGCKR